MEALQFIDGGSIFTVQSLFFHMFNTTMTGYGQTDNAIVTLLESYQQFVDNKADLYGGVSISIPVLEAIQATTVAITLMQVLQ